MAAQLEEKNKIAEGGESGERGGREFIKGKKERERERKEKLGNLVVRLVRVGWDVAAGRNVHLPNGKLGSRRQKWSPRDVNTRADLINRV